ncbi:hypothetical protein BJF84_09005 [Rhodococcus sp. CUA-806]|nr:hypothetical protein BJF84_09005 [Rhodococcus sp. CUA-806]
MVQRSNGIDTPLDMLLHRESTAVNEERIGVAAPGGGDQWISAGWIEQIEVDPERYLADVGGADSLELAARETSRAHHLVVGPGRSSIRDISHGTRGRFREYLAQQPVQPLVRDHDAADSASRRPRTHPTKCQTVGDLEHVRREPGRHVRDPAGVRGSISAGERDTYRGTVIRRTPVGEEFFRRLGPRDHQDHLVPARCVARAQLIDRCPKAT